MKTMNTQNQFKIIILEDNKLYNTILSAQLQNHIEGLALDKGYSFDIQSYTHATDCLQNLKPDIEIAIVDYYLGGSENGLGVLKIINQKCPNCKVIIMSWDDNSKTSSQTLDAGACVFVHKDNTALMKICRLVEDIINERIRS
jgi:DNA-binding NarL/FixJ family response regulator